MILLAKLGVGVLGTIVVAGAALSSEGFVHVKVHEKQRDGANVNILVPAALATTAFRFVPDRHLAHGSDQLREFLPVIDAAIPALRDAPDGVLVEVTNDHEHVLLQKMDASIVVDVNDTEDVVHVSVPLRAAQDAIHEIARRSGTN